jgi:hypothetical protein
MMYAHSAKKRGWVHFPQLNVDLGSETVGPKAVVFVLVGEGMHFP